MGEEITLEGDFCMTVPSLKSWGTRPPVPLSGFAIVRINNQFAKFCLKMASMRARMHACVMLMSVSRN